MDPLQNNESKNLSSIPQSLLQENQSSDIAEYNNPIPLPASLEKYRVYLPSKRIMVVLGAIVIFLVGYIVIPKIPTFFRTIKNIFTQQDSLPASKTPVSTAQTDTDSDGDGIPDWQEALFNLDPTDADSDNDGIPDSVPSDLQALAENPDIVTQQDKLILQILAQLNKDGGINNLTQSQISEKVQTEILKTAESVESGFTTYTLSDTTLADNSPASIRSYKNITNTISGVVPTSETVRKIYSYISPNDTEQYPTLYMNSLESNVTRLLKTPVPRVLSDDHLKLINSSALLHGFINRLNTDKSFYENTDPYIKTLIIQKNLNAIAKSVDNINLYYSINK